MRDATAGDPWSDAAGTKQLLVHIVVIVTIGEQLRCLAPGPAP